MEVWIGDEANVGDCRCGTWLEHWKNHSGERLSMFCYAMACPSTPVAGAAVRMGPGDDECWYIVPLCIEHGARCGERIQLIPGTPLVPADVRRTCEQRRVRV